MSKSYIRMHSLPFSGVSCCMTGICACTLYIGIFAPPGDWFSNNAFSERQAKSRRKVSSRFCLQNVIACCRVIPKTNKAHTVRHVFAPYRRTYAAFLQKNACFVAKGFPVSRKIINLAHWKRRLNAAERKEMALNGVLHNFNTTNR